MLSLSRCNIFKMNSIISLSHLRPAFCSSILKRTLNMGPELRKSLSLQNVSKKPRILCAGQAIESSFTPKRYLNELNRTTLKATLIKQSHETHSQTWIMERLLSVASITSFVAMFIHPCENGELFFAFVIASHSHFGLEAIMVDYLRPIVVGNFIPKLIPVFSVMLSASILALLLWVAMYGNGIAGSLQQLWYLDPLIEPYDTDESKLRLPTTN